MMYVLSLLIVLLFVGIITSYEDHIKNKIRNKILVYGLISGLIIHFLFFSYTWIYESFNYTYFISLLVNFIITIFIGYMLWYFNMWSSGDAKLFILFSLLLPFNYYLWGNVNYFPSFTILFNAFVPLGIVLLIKSLISFNKIKKDFLKELKVKILVLNFFAISGIYWIFAKFITNQMIKFILVLITLIILKKYLENVYFYIGTLLFIFQLAFDGFTSKYFWISLIIFALFYFIRVIILAVPNKVFSKKISVNGLKEGMILSKNFDSEKEFFGAGLTKNQISYIRKKKKFIYIEETVGFAKYLFLGCLLTIFCYGNIVVFLVQLF